MINIRIASSDDLDFLSKLEKNCFPISRQFNCESMKRSLTSSHQLVFVSSCDGHLCGSATVFIYKNSYRIYSIAVLEEFRHQHIGAQLMKHIIATAKVNNIRRITLEVDAKEEILYKWYEGFGFKSIKYLRNYYGNNQPGKRMELVLVETPQNNHNIKNIVVVDTVPDWLNEVKGIVLVKAEDFINSNNYSDPKEMRVFNLCSSYGYQTIGYYVSLFASARGLRAIPNVATIEDFTDETITESIGDEAQGLIHSTFRRFKGEKLNIKVIFGTCEQSKYSDLAKAMYRLFEAPFLDLTFKKNKHWYLDKVIAIPIEKVPLTDRTIKIANKYFDHRHFPVNKFKNYKYDLAILVDPSDPAAPSGSTALVKFKKAAEKIGFYTEFITKDDYKRIPQFDALFIRATTNVNNFTYQFSRYAYSEGLVVIDDPWSIIKCANKLYFHEAMKTQGVTTPKTIIVSPSTDLDEVIEQIHFPIVLKRPDSAASLGVFKVHTKEELQCKLSSLFETGELIIAQEYISSPFDWRIGILENKPLYASKYFMAKGHWQIYNWGSKTQRDMVGGVETLLVENAPANVVETAVKAASIMGDGFYGVDLKEVDGKVYVIEVNDNPSIDRHWEDQILGDELYLMIVRNLMSRIEVARNIKNRAS